MQLLGSGREENDIMVPAVVADPASPRSSTSSMRTNSSRFPIQWWRRSTDDEAEEKEMAEIHLGMA